MKVTKISANELETEISTLLDQGFSVPSGQHYLEDFPIWQSNDDRIKRFACIKEGKPIAFVALRMAELQAKTPLPIALIGGVVTEKGYQGKGIATKLVQDALLDAKANGAAMAMLWGSEESFYQRLGFSLCGEQLMIPVERIPGVLDPASDDQTGITEGMSDRLFEKLCSRGNGLKLSSKDRSWYFKHCHVNWLSVEVNDKVTSYIAWNRGIDLGGFVHEWGGPVDEIVRLLKIARERQNGLMLLFHPSDASFLKVNAKSLERQFFSLVRVFDPHKIVSAFGASLEVELAGIDRFRIPGSTRLLDSGEMARVLFGPNSNLGNGFPLPLWLWGIDCC